MAVAAWCILGALLAWLGYAVAASYSPSAARMFWKRWRNRLKTRRWRPRK
jgi:hypothetical protein